MVLLDTNIISELRKVGTGRADLHATSWISAHDATRFYIPVLTVMELEIGVLRIKSRNPGQGARLRAWPTEQVLPEFAERTLPIDSVVARRCAGLHVPDPRSKRALIAAKALVHGMSVVTRNVLDFEATGMALADPWKP